METVAASAEVIAAVVHAMRGDCAAARRHAGPALASVEPGENGLSRPPGQRRPDQPPDRRPPLPVTAHGQLAPVYAPSGHPRPATTLAAVEELNHAYSGVEVTVAGPGPERIAADGRWAGRR